MAYKKRLREREQKIKGTIAFWDKAASISKFSEDGKVISLTYDLITDVIKAVSKDLIDVKKYHPFLNSIYNKFRQKGLNDFHPNILIIDSLNIVSNNDERSKLFENISENLTNTDLVVFIIDSVDPQHSDWEFKSDIILRLDYYSNDYFLRTIEVVKARNQEHILGKHQLKIHSKYEEDTSENQRCCDKNIIHHRSHPYRESGGIIIYPSIHYYLSGYRKRSAPTSTEKLTESPFQLGKIFNLPFGRCTGLVGDRGTHKSHMAYMYLLHNIIAYGYRGLIITLREDEKKTVETLQTILTQIVNQNAYNNSPSSNLYDYIHENRLEILYFIPGYITPNEFFHRIFVSTHRMKQNDSKVISIFNSLDQIEARFPLCTKEDIFIPSIIEFFLGEHITNIFIAVNEEGRTLDKYGLLPMADYVLSYKKDPEVKYKEFQDQFMKNNDLKDYFIARNIEANTIETVIVKVDKHSGGRPQVKKGFLELDSTKKYFKEEGIYFS